MLSGTFATRVRAIAEDRTSGSAQLARLSAEALSLASPDELAEAADAIARSQPAMAAVYNAARAALEHRLPEFVRRLAESETAVCRRAAELVRNRVVLTHSHSSTVLRALREGGPSHVICTESLPGGEGAKTAAALGAEVIADTAIYRAMERADVVVVGADAATPDAVINKVGTALVALAARERAVPRWVLCGPEKVVPAGWQPDTGMLFEATPRSWFTGLIGPDL